MYIVKETIRYNDVTYKKGQKVDFTNEDIKEISEFVEEIKGEQSKTIQKIVVNDKENKLEEDNKVEIEDNKIETKKSTKIRSTKK